jgi:hypothetical protein
MAVTAHPYGLMLESLVEGRINVRADPMYAMLVTNAYVFNQNTHKFKSVATPGEIAAASGYVAGGKQVTGLLPTYSAAAKSLTMPAGNLNWGVISFTGVVGAVLYMAPAGIGDAAKPLVAYVDFGGAQSRDNQAFYINWPPSLLTLGPVP